MAFTFTVEDGTGLTAANSYASVVEADDILVVNIHASSTWSALTNTQKEYLLAWSSRYLDSHADWYGNKTVETSGLRWPRTGVTDRDGITISSTVIPSQLKVATAEMARYLIAEDRTSERAQDAIKMLKADVVEIEFIEGYRLPQIPSHLTYLITGLGILRGGKPNFAKITRV